MSVTFICCGCGWSIHSMALGRPPEHGRCLTCSFIAGIEDPEEREEMRRRLVHERDAA